MASVPATIATSSSAKIAQASEGPPVARRQEVQWHSDVARGGPFSAWMLQHPDNILFEVAPHAFAHIAQLLGRPDRLTVHAWDPLDLARGPRFWRRWEILAWKGTTTVRVYYGGASSLLSATLVPHPDRPNATNGCR